MRDRWKIAIALAIVTIVLLGLMVAANMAANGG